MKKLAATAILASLMCACDERSAVDAGVDAPIVVDAGTDGGALDARLEVRSDAPRDAPPDAQAAAAIYDITDPAEVTRRAVDALFCNDEADRACGLGIRCGCSTGTLPPDRAACIATELATCREGRTEFIGTVLSEMALSSELTDACIARQQALRDGCEVASPFEIDVCTRIVSTTEELGASCTTGYLRRLCGEGQGTCSSTGSCVELGGAGFDCNEADCHSGLVCQGTTCGAPAAATESCASTRECAAPLVCINGACGTRVALGAACTSNESCGFGARCSASLCVAGTSACPASGPSCGSGYSCTDSAVFVCRSRGTTGATCAFNNECADGLLCLSGLCAASVTPGLGESCYDITAQFLTCEEGFTCDVDTTVTCVARLGAGAVCTRPVCASGLACVAGTCATAPTAGQDCGLEGGCAAGLVCDSESRCANYQAAGDECVVGICGPGLVCRGSLTCERLATQTEACASNSECIPSLLCVDGTCSVGASVGASCSPVECAARAFCFAEPFVACEADGDRCS